MHNFKIFLKTIIFLILVIMGSYIVFVFEVPDYSAYNRLMMNDLYGQQETDIIFLGSSKVYSCINPYIVDEKLKKNTFNLASSGQKMIGSYYLLNEFLTNAKKPPQYVIMDIQYSTFKKEEPSGNMFENYVITDYMKKNLNYWRFFIHAYEPENYFNAICPTYHYRDNFNINTVKTRLENDYFNKFRNYEYFGEYAGKGYRRSEREIGKKIGRVLDNTSVQFDEIKNNINEKEYKYFNDIIKLCKQNNIELILVTIPSVDGLYYELNDYEKVYEFYSDIAKKNNIHYYDLNLNKAYTAIKNDENDFYDAGHMNITGAEKLTNTLCDVLLMREMDNFDYNNYFYLSYNKWFENNIGIFNVWFNVSQINENKIQLEAFSTQSNKNNVEYQFLYSTCDSNEWNIIRDYSNNSSCTFKANLEKYKFRVNIKNISEENYSRFWELEYILD